MMADGSIVDVTVPQCDSTQCDGAHSVTPCWCIGPKTACMPPVSPDGVGLTIDRGMTNGMKNQAPPHTNAIVTCVTQAGP